MGVWPTSLMVLAGCLDIDASKERRPLCALLRRFQHSDPDLGEDVPGFMPGTSQEYGGIIKHGAKLLYAYAVRPPCPR